MKDAIPATKFPMLGDSLCGDAATVQLLLDHVDCVRFKPQTIGGDPIE